jgi:hypothetical protein
MQQINLDIDCEAIGRRYAILSAFVGVLVAIGLIEVFMRDGLLSISELFPFIAVGVLSLFFSALVVGRWAGKVIFHSSPVKAIAIGIVTALLCLELSINAGLISAFIIYADPATSLLKQVHLYIIKPAYVVSVVGLLPALLLGAFYGILTWHVTTTARHTQNHNSRYIS